MAGKLQSDVAWNVASLAILGIAGLALNVLIGQHWDESTLGVFNQALAAYTFFSMAAVGGIDRSALRAVAEAGHDRARAAAAAWATLVPTALIAALAAAAYWFARWPIARLLESDGVAAAIEASAPGLFFFALNKVLLAIVNGEGRMRAFAVYQSLRYIGILVALFAAMREGLDGDRLMVVFTFSEGVLLLVAGIDVARLLRSAPGGWATEVRGHVVFGAKSAFSGVLLELNAKVDVWMIGIFMSDAAVGVYTYAAMLAEGLYQLVVVLQNVYNPRLARHIAAGEGEAVHELVRRGRTWSWIGITAVGAIAVAAFPLALSIIGARPEFSAAHWPFGLLVAGIALSAGYLPFGQILLMGGRPATHTVLMATTVLANVVGNAILIPRHGLIGAAIATAISMALSVVLLRVLVRAKLGLRI
ncbi:MAG: polysaccharide biosynthesis C-terminal domain-containing protein [Planctomycetota bacterium]|nr:polysaccharide biosynthesis C-terminal domain-containing protein [Planctomycetota bacterium]